VLTDAVQEGTRKKKKEKILARQEKKKRDRSAAIDKKKEVGKEGWEKKVLVVYKTSSEGRRESRPRHRGRKKKDGHSFVVAGERGGFRFRSCPGNREGRRPEKGGR